MELMTDPDEASRQSRLVGINMVVLSLRLRANWARLFGDAESAAIGLAIVATVSDRLLRADLEEELKSLSVPMPPEDLACCNIHSIAVATGLNREKARRKVDRLIAKGMVVRDHDTILLAPGFTQREITSSIVHEQLAEIRRVANTLLRMGVLTVRASTPEK